MGRLFANEQLAGRLDIHPKKIVSSSEVLTPEARHLITEAWWNILFNGYSATEVGALALECDQHTGMHLWEDLFVCEVVDSQNRPVPPGEYGDKLLITTLFKYAQPLIRYEISDSVRLSKQACPCGRPLRLIEAVQGRTEDVLHFKKGGKDIEIQPILFHTVVDALPVDGWQVVQRSEGICLLVAGVHGDFNEQDVVVRLQKALSQQGAGFLTVKVKRVTSIPKNKIGKSPLIVARKS